jgi:O-antigen/teichoic acid export membrane protein
MGFGAQMFGSNLINMINLQADTVFLGYFLTAADVGYYSAATGLSKFFWIVPQAIQTISYPATSEYWVKRDTWGLQKMLDKSMKYTALALMPAGLAIGFFAEEIVTRIYGQGFSNSALPLQILLIGTVIFGVFCTSIGGSLAGVNRPDLSLKAAGLSATINVILNVLLIPRFGILGAATATAVSLITMALIFYSLTIKTVSLKARIKWMVEVAGITSLAIIIFVIFAASINSNALRIGILLAFSILSLIILIEKDEIVLLKSSLMALKKKI